MTTIINPKNYRVILAECLTQTGDGDLYVFGYGSLMWRPGFRAKQVASARVHGYARRLSVKSTHYRGTAKTPGLVFGLDAGGSCNGVVLQAAAKDKPRIIKDLFRREMFANVYEPRFITVRRQSDNASIRALTFVVRREGAHYVATMSPAAAAKIIRRASGIGGKNADYIINTHHELTKRGIPCPSLEKLRRLVEKN